MSTQVTSHVESFEPSRSPSLWHAVVRTSDATAPTYLRVVLGAVMFPHAAQKAFGWFGGSGVSATLDFLRNALHLPNALGFLVIAFELVGSVALLVGAFTRAAAVAIAVIMLGAVVLVHGPNGFFMNWFGNQAGEGFEYHLLVFGMVAALIVQGGGRASVDRWLDHRGDR
jgi:putative oxidoreductase